MGNCRAQLKLNSNCLYLPARVLVGLGHSWLLACCLQLLCCCFFLLYLGVGAGLVYYSILILLRHPFHCGPAHLSHQLHMSETFSWLIFLCLSVCGVAAYLGAVVSSVSLCMAVYASSANWQMMLRGMFHDYLFIPLHMFVACDLQRILWHVFVCWFSSWPYSCWGWIG